MPATTIGGGYMLDKKDIEAIAGLIKNSESLLLDEIERYDKINEKRISDITKDIGELKESFRISKNENDTINMLLRIIENLEKRVSELENKIT